ncbi:MAG: LexA repressor [Thermoanaerobaculia bacterium]|nr:LexA repressor [Thermoanaerobaculia bacterium]
MSEIALTPRQKEILDFIRDYRRRKGVSPTQREICQNFGYSSFGTLQKHIRLLMDKGILVREKNKRRSLLVSGEGAGAEKGLLQLPLLGRIAAGSPIEVLPGTELVLVPEMLTRRGENFVLKVRGESMIDEGIQDGDLVVLQRRATAENGELVAALVKGEATLKRFHREADNRVRLQPSNQAMQPILARADEVEVQGIVVGLMRKY